MIWMNTKTGEVVGTFKEVIKATIENFCYYKIVTLHWVRIKA